MYVVRFRYRGDWIISGSEGHNAERWYSKEGFIWMRLLG